MELNNIKKLWEEVNLLKEKQQFNDEKIKDMLKSKQETARTKLMKLSIIGAVIAIPVCFLVYLQICDNFEPGVLRTAFLLGFSFSIAIAVPAEIYSYHLLKGINYSHMTTKNAYERILKYQRLTQKGRLFGIILLVVFVAPYSYFVYKQNFGTEVVWAQIIFLTVIFLGGFVAMHLLYKKLYFERIKQIKQSLKELEEFEKN